MQPQISNGFSITFKFLQHIFGEEIEKGISYIKTTFLFKDEKLPPLVLSGPPECGKTLFAKMMRVLIGENLVIINDNDLQSDFNAHWTTKSIVVCDEARLNKADVIAKIKALTTSEKITINERGCYPKEIKGFIKFVLVTNETAPIDRRFWHIKVPPIKSTFPDLMQAFGDERDEFVKFLISVN